MRASRKIAKHLRDENTIGRLLGNVGIEMRKVHNGKLVVVTLVVDLGTYCFFSAVIVKSRKWVEVVLRVVGFKVSSGG